MRIVRGTPPNYIKIRDRFNLGTKNVVFTYGNTLYNPTGGVISHHLMEHEKTHAKQQEVMGVEQWWDRYLLDDQFRLRQELEAYRAQYRSLKSRPERRRVLMKISKDLASSIYGKIISKEQAKELILSDTI